MSDQQPRSRQEIYDLLRQYGREEFILQEMIRYGFWSEDEGLPEDPEEEVKRKEEIRVELSKLTQEKRNLQNEKTLRRRLLKERLAEAKRKRQETKERREQERLERAQQWQEQKERDIVYLGEKVSAGLNERRTAEQKLADNDLPLLTTPAEIATAMGITVGELRFLAFDRPVSTVSHYIQFKIPKKTGGERVINAPMPRLKQAQSWLLHNILEKIEPEPAAHGFRSGYSIVSNAKPHVGAKVIINLDLKDFFPSISYPRVKGLYLSFGYGEAVSTIFALLSTAADIETIELDGTTYYVAVGTRHLPQGSPASPAITNILCRRLDRRLTKLAEQLGFVYTRYADDLTFSTPTDNSRICNLLRNIESIVAHEGLTINTDKTRILRQGSQQEVTGIVVNDHLSIDRKTLKRFRATLYQIEKDGPEGKHWGNSTNVMASIQGFTNFVSMVNPTKGAEFQAQIERIKQKLAATPKTEVIIVECYKHKSKLKVRVVSPGYNSEWNVQFPKNIREEGARYLVEELRIASSGGFYRAYGKIEKLES